MLGQPSFQAVKEEFAELLEDKSLEEVVDVIHSLGRFANLPLPLLYFVCRKTALKHAKRVQKRGCPRSERNCNAAGETCCCRK